ncbi:SufE family protein [Sulfurospirillum sp. 1612]|uniref:SufE family protein n=1 Tax=Sulfurospirillum sp. 1612 TaxID=3094835 RepID=UPI002F9488F3
MSSEIETRIEEIVEELSFFDDELEKYEYLVDTGKALSPLSEDEKQEQYLIQGCTSQVWLICENTDGKLIFRGDSNTVIVKGLVALIIKIFSDLTPKEIVDFDTDRLGVLGLSEIITPNRQNGLKSMIERIKTYAQEAYHD